VVPRPAPPPASGGQRAASGLSVAQRADQKKRDRRIKKIDEEIAALEERVAAAERERERNDLLLCSEEVYRDGERMKKIQARNADLKAMIGLLSVKWETLSREREQLEGAVA